MVFSIGNHSYVKGDRARSDKRGANVGHRSPFRAFEDHLDKHELVARIDVVDRPWHRDGCLGQGVHHDRAVRGDGLGVDR